MDKIKRFINHHLFKILISLICLITTFNFFRSTQINNEGHWGIKKHEPNGSLIHIAKDSPQIWARTKVYSYLKLKYEGVKLINIYSEKNPFDESFAKSLGNFRISLKNRRNQFKEPRVNNLNFTKLDLQRSGSELYFSPSQKKISTYAFFRLNGNSYLIPEAEND